MPPVSILVNSYNNGQFLRDALDSALAQEGVAVEVIVVDDGSTDDSRSIIESYGTALTSLFKENGGQGSAMNAGFASSCGDVVIFLDSDDRLEPYAARRAGEILRARPDAGKLHWPLKVIDAHGQPTGEFNDTDLEEGDLAERVLTGGPYAYRWSPGGGSAWHRRVLERLMPVDEVTFDNGADNLLCALAPLFGPVLTCESLACWRHHSSNYSLRASPFIERLRDWLARFDVILETTERLASELSLPFDRDAWLAESWFHRIDRAVRVIDENVPSDTPVILLDQDSWETHGEINGRQCLPCPEWKGRYAGLPADEAHAVEALEAVADSRPVAVAVAWPAMWWLKYYRLEPYLAERFRPVARTPDLHLFVDPRIGSAHA